MDNKTDKKDSGKGFFGRLLDKLDKKMQEKAKSGSCCCKAGSKESDKTCCS
jgi:hypothetical protein